MLLLDDRPHVTFWVDDRLVYRGPSLSKLEQMHREGWCDAMCGFCYHEACQFLATQPVAEALPAPVAPHGLCVRRGLCITCPFNDGLNEEATHAQNLGCLPTKWDILKARDERGEVWMCHDDETKVCGGLAQGRPVESGKPILYSRWYHGLPS